MIGARLAVHRAYRDGRRSIPTPIIEEIPDGPFSNWRVTRWIGVGPDDDTEALVARATVVGGLQIEFDLLSDREGS